jgi:uncharacterized SAM-binding protein YcdF (DUF218 family)
MFKLLKLLIFIVAVAALIFYGHGFILGKAGEFIFKKDDLKPADVIVVLAGEQTERVEHGVKLFNEGWARKDRIIMAGGPIVWKYSWAYLMKKHAEHLGISGKVILLEDKSRSTEEDAKFTKKILNKNGYKSIILVTSPYHSKRADKIFQRVIGKDIKIINAPVENSWFKFDNWWKRRRDRAMVLNEYSKFVWLWIFGLQ